MEYIPLLKQRKNALNECSKFQKIPIDKRTSMISNLQILNTWPWITKGIIVVSIILGVNWKKNVPFIKRQLPLAIGAIFLSAASDFLINQYIWKQHELQVVKLTGFKNGIFVSPQRMQKMRQKMLLPSNLSDQYGDDDLIIENDEQLIKKI